MTDKNSDYVKVKYEDGADKYEVRLSAHTEQLTVAKMISLDWNTNVFEGMRGDPNLRRLQGERLVEYVIRKAGDDIYKIERTKNGQANNGINGEPALIEFSKGKVTFNYCTEGKLNDGPNGEPAHQVFAKTKEGWVPSEIKSFKEGVEAPVTGEVKYAAKVKVAGPKM